MSSAVGELDAALQGMLSLKPPGVSGSRIQGITALCVANVQVRSSSSNYKRGRNPCLAAANFTSQSESVLIQKLYTHFRKAPGTHKLGVLYVVDSVTRKWTESAKAAGQPISSSAQDGTFAAGVNRVKELLPALMNDIVQTAPDDQKVRPIDLNTVISLYRHKVMSQNASTKCSPENGISLRFLIFSP